MDHSPYLDKPFVPLAAALPRMLAAIETELATSLPAEKWRLRNKGPNWCAAYSHPANLPAMMRH